MKRIIGITMLALAAAFFSSAAVSSEKAASAPTSIAAGFLTHTENAEVPCSFWDVGGQFTVTQNNGYAPVFDLNQSDQGRITGSASYEHGPSGFVTTGTVAEGSNISGSQFHVVIRWDNHTRGIYDGTFSSSGRLSGHTCDEMHPESCADWSVKRRKFACLRP